MIKTRFSIDGWKQRKIKTWDDAFRALTPAMRQHSVRVADYSQVLFDGVCQSAYYSMDEDKPEYLNESYREIVYKCGFFHQIGKALAPEEYPAWDDKFTTDEKNNYCRYTVDGKELAERLQTERHGFDERVSDRMIKDACEFHMEQWDGNGFPYGYAGNEISLIAQIVGLAKEMDRLVCERKSETPYEDAVEILLAEENQMFSAHLLDVFRDCQTELKNVYKKYIQYTKIMPKTIPLVEKRSDRPFGLTYRQIVRGESVDTFLFEAVPWFGAVLDKPEEKQSAEEVESLLMRTGMTKDITTYFLYEAADALARISNCELCIGGIILPVFSAFYTGGNCTETFEKFYADTGIDRKKLMLTVQETLLLKEHKVSERLTDYSDQGIRFVLDDYHPEDLPIEQVRAIGIKHVRIARDSVSWNHMEQTIQDLKNLGITFVDWPSGETNLTEDELIRYLLNYEDI